eukprot:366279-Chlamydomonas_euryale.AAC.23
MSCKHLRRCLRGQHHQECFVSHRPCPRAPARACAGCAMPPPAKAASESLVDHARERLHERAQVALHCRVAREERHVAGDALHMLQRAAQRHHAVPQSPHVVVGQHRSLQLLDVGRSGRGRLREGLQVGHHAALLAAGHATAHVTKHSQNVVLTVSHCPAAAQLLPSCCPAPPHGQYTPAGLPLPSNPVQPPYTTGLPLPSTTVRPPYTTGLPLPSTT